MASPQLAELGNNSLRQQNVGLNFPRSTKQKIINGYSSLSTSIVNLWKCVCKKKDTESEHETIGFDDCTHAKQTSRVLKKAMNIIELRKANQMKELDKIKSTDRITLKTLGNLNSLSMVRSSPLSSFSWFGVFEADVYT